MDVIGLVVIVGLLAVTAWALLSIGKTDDPTASTKAAPAAPAAAEPDVAAAEPEPDPEPEVASPKADDKASEPAASDADASDADFDEDDEDESDMETVQASPEELRDLLASVGTSNEE